MDPEGEKAGPERPGRSKRLRRKNPMRDNSRNIAIHMTAARYERLQRYLSLTPLTVTAYFRKLIHEDSIRVRAPWFRLSLHAETGRLHSNVRQIARHAKELYAGTVRRLEFIAGKLTEQAGLLSMQK